VRVARRHCRSGGVIAHRPLSAGSLAKLGYSYEWAAALNLGPCLAESPAAPVTGLPSMLTVSGSHGGRPSARRSFQYCQ